LNFQSPYFLYQSIKASLYVLDQAFAAPMPFGWKVDDKPRMMKPVQVEDQHLAGPKFSTVAGCFISLVVFGKRLAELQRDAAPHNSDTVDGVDERFRVCVENVALLKLNHRSISCN
jgi:hypothetical protein